VVIIETIFECHGVRRSPSRDNMVESADSVKASPKDAICKTSVENTTGSNVEEMIE
jgi:hypothetical protein